MGLPKFLTHGAPLGRFRHWISAKENEKTCASESQLVLALFLIGGENGASVLNQSLSVYFKTKGNANIPSMLK